MEHPGPLLIVVGVEQANQVVCCGIQHRPGGFFCCEYLGCRLAHDGLEGTVSISMKPPKCREVRRKSLREPEMVPVSLGHRITKPLMRRLVGYNALVHIRLTVAFLVVKDGGAVLHAAVTGARLDVSQSRIGEWSNELSEVVDDLPSPAKGPVHRIARVARVGPDRNRDALSSTA